MISALAGETPALVRVTVVDSSGAAVENAHVAILSAQNAPLAEARTDAAGRAALGPVAPGAYAVEARAGGFAEARAPVRIGVDDGAQDIALTLNPSAVHTRITVTPARGSVEEEADSTHVVAVVSDGLRGRPLATLGNTLESSPGILVQQSTPGQASPFLRGLTGYHVLNLIDSVRFNNSTFRSGPNQYLALVEPSQVDRIEVVLGPTGAQYGSDALGGAIQLVTPAPAFGGGGPHGRVNVFGATADRSGGAHAQVEFSSRRIAWLAGGGARRHNDVRPGGGIDSRNVFRRLFGLDAPAVRELTGDTLQDSGFSQAGAHTKLAIRPGQDQAIALWYQTSAQRGVRGYKDLLGGLGRLQSAFDPQSVHFLYGRYERFGAGPFESVSATLSLNSQRDGSIRQGLRYTDPIIRDRVAVDAYGYAFQATAAVARRHVIAFGADTYDEHVGATRIERNPVSATERWTRALYPNGSRYVTYAAFGQHSMEFGGRRLRWLTGARATGVRFRAFADRNRDPSGRDLGVADTTQSFGDLSFHTSLSAQATRSIGLHAVVSRGFRAPNLNDLGAIGLNDLGYEVPASAAIDSGALLSTSAGEAALSAGRRLRGLGPERLYNYEAGVRIQSRSFYGRLQAFDAELLNPIVRRTLLFPAASPPQNLAGIPVTALEPTAAQRAQGVSAVATAFDPRAVKAFVNDGHARYYGLEALARCSIRGPWSIEGAWSFLNGRDLNPNRPARRLPPQLGHAALRYVLAGRRPWIEWGVRFAGPQDRLSGGDLDDERIGAARSRRDIADFFNGALASPYVNAAGVFTPTGETLAQIQNRVINPALVASDSTRVPLELKTAGWAAIDLRGGWPLGEAVMLDFALMNLFDRNYRIHGSGADSPGFNAYLGVRYRF